MIKNTVLFLSIICASGVMIVNIYNSLVDAPSWGISLPESIETARKYYSVVNPGTFFRVFSPATQVLALLALVLFWKSFPSVRLYLGIALIIYVAGDAFTFGYFYPRNSIMMGGTTDMEVVKQAWMQWSSMNWIRTGLIATGLFFSCFSLHKVYLQS